LGRLKWLTTIVPALAVFGYETARHSLLESLLPEAWGNLIAGLVTLFLAYIFSEIVFRIVERLQAQALEQSREMTELGTILTERERLSRELHDGLAQLVAYLLVRIDTVEGLVGSNRLAEATEELERLRSSADDLYVDIRESISGLRAQVVEHGLPPALNDYVQHFKERYGIDVALECDAIPDACSPLVHLQLFRIAQEALANIRRHADAQHVAVRVETDAGRDQILLSIEDDGSGFDPETVAEGQPRSFGLSMMKERSEELGGRLQIESQAGSGTRVTAIIPVRRAGAVPGKVTADARPAR